MLQTPQVRIGMIQDADQIEFQVNSDFDFVGADGNVLAGGQAKRDYAITLQGAVPARIQYWARLAIRETMADAKNAAARLQDQGWAVQIRTYGLVLDLPGLTMDNREYWLLHGPFASIKIAEQFVATYEPAGEAAIVPEVVDQATGWLEFDDLKVAERVTIVPRRPESLITLKQVLVGIEFHWQHYQAQQYKGTLEVTLNNYGRLAAINIVSIDDYLASVNASEMTEDCPTELLRSHTVIARSTILATMGKHHHAEPFHLCADDHCQRYYGAGVEAGPSRQATQDTAGEVLLFNNRVCDARYSKICGGVMEAYQNVWDNREIPYLSAGVDGKEPIPWPIDSDEKARKFIESDPDVFCNTRRYKLPEQLAASSKDLFHWRVSFTNPELCELIAQKTRVDFGYLIDIIPLTRGASGRIFSMQVVGSEKTLTIGKELAIRRVLSTSHLYSSCFVIDRERDERGNVVRFHLIGAGWGHGVGLCQVGATNMAQLGYHYRDILAHYYPHTKIIKIY